jgi:hypothetical protein
MAGGELVGMYGYIRTQARGGTQIIATTWCNWQHQPSVIKVAMVVPVLSYERKRFLFHEMARRRGLTGRWKYTKEEKLILSFIQKGLYGFQAAVHYFSSHSQFARMKEGMMTKLQAVYQTENLVFVVHHDKELREKVLNVYGAQIECIKQRSKKDVEYNQDLLSRLYEAVKKHYLLQQSARLRHQLFLTNKKINKNI